MAGHDTDTPTKRDLSINRQSLYINDGEISLFAWYHTCALTLAANCVAVLCSPLGYEYIHSHRAMRHLADQLAACGIPTLRFDYHGTGDSPGDDLEPDRLNCWLQNIKAAMAQARALSGCSQVCLIGLSMGATLAALVASEIEVAYLVLWSPYVNGRRYVREMQALALLADNDTPKSDEVNEDDKAETGNGVMESAGFVMSAATSEQLKKVNLLKLNLKVDKQVLVIGRDDLAMDSTLPDKLNADNICTDYVSPSGFAEMMAEPQFTIVPTRTIQTISDWLVRNLEGNATIKSLPSFNQLESIPSDKHLGAPSLRINYHGLDASQVTLEEQPCHFGKDNRLFGILSYLNEPATNKPVFVFLNAGSVHHVGPNRIYVTLARTLTACGYTCLRMGLEGLGDSISDDNAAENHPYPATAVRDTDEALQYLTNQFHCNQFILIGLCSGAHTAFHAGLELTQHNIEEAMLINPLTFHWEEGMSLETTQSVQHFQDVAHYKQSARNIKSWKKLLKGRVKISYLTGVALSQSKIMLKSQRDSLYERIHRQDLQESTRLAVDLKRYFDLKRRLTLFIASTDPGYDILMAEAQSIARQGIKEKKINLQFIKDADHTFSRHEKSRELISLICDHMNPTAE